MATAVKRNFQMTLAAVIYSCMKIVDEKKSKMTFLRFLLTKSEEILLNSNLGG